MGLYFIQGLTLGFSAAVSPGPFQAYLLSQATRRGLWRTLPVAFAPLLSDGPIVVLVLFVLTRLPDGLMRGLRVAGGAFLVYLAWGAFKAWRAAPPAAPDEQAAGGRSLLKGALMNALSPGPYLFWGTVAGPIVLQGWAVSPVLGASFVIGFYLALIGGFAGFVILFAAARRLGPRVAHALNGLSAVALLAFGVWQVAQGIG